LRQGISILDAVHELEYFDQPHLTRSLRRWVGYTPAEIIRTSQRIACQAVPDDPASRDDRVEHSLARVW
jgi:hypothetical protein